MSRMIYMLIISGVLASVFCFVISSLLAKHEAKSLYEEIKKEQPEMFQGLSSLIIKRCLTDGGGVMDSNIILNACIKNFVDSGHDEIEQKRRNLYFIESGRAPYKPEI
jgi:hypothetical protein